MRKTILIFGCGYSARFVAQNLITQGWTVYGTTRLKENFSELLELKIKPVLWDDVARINNILVEGCSLLSSIAPKLSSDVGLDRLSDTIASGGYKINWLGYMSSTGVYGDRSGGWVNEESVLDTKTSQGKARVEAEKKWQKFADEIGAPLFIFRIAGIYGPGRSIFDKLKSGRAKKVIKKGQFFNRIHVEDIGGAISVSLLKTELSGVFNLSDDLPAASGDVVDEATKIMKIKPLPQIDFSHSDLTDMARSFYSESKKVSNKKLAQILNYSLKYPTYLSGLRGIFGDDNQY